MLYVFVQLGITVPAVLVVVLIVFAQVGELLLLQVQHMPKYN